MSETSMWITSIVLAIAIIGILYILFSKTDLADWLFPIFFTVAILIGVVIFILIIASVIYTAISGDTTVLHTLIAEY